VHCSCGLDRPGRGAIAGAPGAGRNVAVQAPLWGRGESVPVKPRPHR
jgi:hypothetical protein